jgi:hypothetical protein
MRKIRESKDIYDHIKIPGELRQIVDNTLNEQAGKLNSGKNKLKDNFAFRVFKYTITAAAVLVVCFTVALNTSEVFAKGLDRIPVINSLAKVLTVRSYEEVKENQSISVKVPGVEIAQEDKSGFREEDKEKQVEREQFVTDVNKEIEQIIDEYVASAKKSIEEYKQAFIKTGGTEEEWNQKNIDIKADYDVKYETEEYLSLVLTADESWCAAYGKRYFYNLDLKKNTQITLKDVLGEDYVPVSNEIIISQMKKRVQENTDYIYWGIAGEGFADMEGFTSVDQDTNFYINEKGNPVICFDKYEVAPGFMGMQEFEIIK